MDISRPLRSIFPGRLAIWSIGFYYIINVSNGGLAEKGEGRVWIIAFRYYVCKCLFNRLLNGFFEDC